MELFVHKNRNVVVKRGDDGDKVLVSFVGVAEGVEGSKRRGRHPNYNKLAVKPSELVAFEAPSAEWMERAEMALSPVVENASESSEDAPGMAEEVGA